jgi:hypothetical protein
MMAKETKRVQIKPATKDVGRGCLEQLTVPYPTAVGRRGKILPPEGATVSLEGTDGSYWQRRITEGSVIVVEPEPVEPEPTKTDRKKGDSQ